MMNEFWNKNDELRLVEFVYFAKDSEAVKQFITKAREASHLPASGFDFFNSPQSEPRKLIEKIYNALCQQNIEYDLSEYVPSRNQNQLQKIRPAEVILQQQSKGTCLDLAILFCAICSHFNLLPLLIFLEGHTLAAVSLTHSFQDWENEERCGQKEFWKELGRLKNEDKDKLMLDREAYLPIECTGFARSEALSENGEFERKDGLLSFEQAIELGKEQVKQKELIFALDIPTAYNFWLPKVFRERLAQEAPKSWNNDKNLLNEIYVPLGLIKRKKNAHPRPKSNQIDPENPEYNKPDKEDEVLIEYKHDEFFDEVLKNKNNTKSQGKRLLIIGDPGGGKSTFLQKIADWVLKEEQGLPIWISLAKFNENLVADKDVSDSGWLYRYLSEQWLRNLSKKGKKTPEKWQHIFEELCESHQIWLLLDGADEMAVSNPLTEIQEQLAKGWSDSVRVVLSCRLNLWEQQKDNLIEEFDIYRTLDFNYPEQIHQFINNWFGKDNPTANKLQEKLEEENRERLRNLVKNPLRLALLCRLWDDGYDTLPKTKAGFYQSLVDSFYRWKDDAKKKFNIPSKIKNELNICLGKLAKIAIDNSNFRFRMRKNFIRGYLGSPDDENSLFSWALKLGWLLHIGYPTEGEDDKAEKVYAFFHPTFQEYFAATVDKTYDFFLPSEHKDRPVKDKHYRIFEPQWKEVILLWLGRTDVDREQKEKFIQHLVNFEDGSGKFYCYQAYFLAAAGIAEFKDCSRADEIVKQIVQWSCGYSDEKQEQPQFPNVVALTAKPVLQETDRTKAIAFLGESLTNSSYESVRRTSAEFLVKIGSESSIDPLVKALGDHDRDVRANAAKALGEIGSELAINPLIQALQDSAWRVSNQAAEALGEIGSELAIEPLVQALKDPDYYSVRANAAEALGEIGSESAIEPLVQALEDPNDEVFYQAAEALGKIGSELAIEPLVQALKDPDNNLRRYAAEALGKIGSESVIDPLVKTLGDPDSDVRRYAAEALGKIGSESVIDPLVKTLGDPDSDVRRYAASALGEIGFESVIDPLVKTLDDPDSDVRIWAAVALGMQAEALARIGSESALIPLLEALGNPDNYVRRIVADFMTTINYEIPINPLINTLEDPELFVRLRVMHALGKTGSELAIEPLVQALKDPDYYSVRASAASALGEIGSESAIEPLFQALEDPCSEVRYQAAEALGKIGSELAINPLVKALGVPDNDLRRYAASALGEIGFESAIIPLVQAALEDLDDGVRANAVEALGKICSQSTIPYILINIIADLALFDPNDSVRGKAAEALGKISAKSPLIEGVILNLRNSYQRSKKCYEVIWNCAQNMTYPAFYQLWRYKYTLDTSIVQRLKLANLPQIPTEKLDLANLPQILTEKIVKDTVLWDKAKLIFIDGSKFIDRDNPASKIYTEIVKGGCARSEDGILKTMLELQAYWDLLEIESDKCVVLIFYENPTGRKPQGFSEVFLDALSAFDGAICVVTEQSIDIDSLQWFTPNQTVEDVIAWISHNIS